MDREVALQILLSGKNVLLTGAAGTGKTTLIEEFTKIARDQEKNVAVTATTGLAATHVNGTTIHNWSGIGVHNKYMERIVKNMYPRYRNAIEKANILIIDEISMLKDSQFDDIERIVREVRHVNKPFGGLQIVACGDFFQLPPIDNSKNSYFSNFITNSKSFKHGWFTVCYLDRNYRVLNKEDPLNVILNAIRMNKFQNTQKDLLENRKNISLHPKIVSKIYCLNREVDKENKTQLANISNSEKKYTWSVSSKDGNHIKELKELKGICKAVPEHLFLKNGATVMFIKNDTKTEKEFYNGSLGKIIGFDENGFPNVSLNNGKKLTGVKPAEWYMEDGKGRKLASIKQIPLKLAWAITVHKSQGMTLDAASIDLSNAFNKGMGYVALSRVRSIDDLSLKGFNDIALEVSPHALKLESQLQKASKVAEIRAYLFEGKKYTLEELDIVFNFDDKELTRIKKSAYNHIALFIENEELPEGVKDDDILMFTGQDPGINQSAFLNKCLCDAFNNRQIKIFLFKNNIYFGERFICQVPHRVEDQWKFPLKRESHLW